MWCGALSAPLPLWGGVGGGGRAKWHARAELARPPTPTLPQPKPRIRGFRPLNKVIEIGNSRFRLGGGRRGRGATRDGGGPRNRPIDASVTIRIGFQQMSNVAGGQQGYVKVDKT